MLECKNNFLSLEDKQFSNKFRQGFGFFVCYVTFKIEATLIHTIPVNIG
jgi:hypothetical protein